ncbi:MAG TPA: hypothetical protein VLA28_01575 [Afifellaceae bacterium]|nr:hypothetical protein [Afifellaceae bacterium]
MHVGGQDPGRRRHQEIIDLHYPPNESSRLAGLNANRDDRRMRAFWPDNCANHPD